MEKNYKGRTSWNKGIKWSEEIKRKISKAHKGKKLSEETKKKIGFAIKNSEAHKLAMLSEESRKKKSVSKLGNKNGMWKGEKAGYCAIHIWITKRFPKTKKCQNCKKVPPYDLANISGEYKRDLSDWKWLCRRCHMKEDGRMEKFIEKGLVNCKKYRDFLANDKAMGVIVN